MKNIKDLLWLLAVLSLLSGMLYCAWQAYQSAQEYETLAGDIYQALTPEQGTSILGKRVLEAVTLGWYRPHSDWLERLGALKQKQARAREQAGWWSSGFFALALSMTGILALWRRSWRVVAHGLSWTSIIALVVGLYAPLLMIAAYQELPVVGRLIFQFQSKGIVTTIQSLFDSGNPLVAMAILTFSVLFPIVKSIALLAASTPGLHAHGARMLAYVHVLGKWSMADVFVAALLLTYFIGDGNSMTHAEIQSGFYFFCGYVLLSLIASQILMRQYPE